MGAFQFLEGSGKIDLDFNVSQFIMKEENSFLIYSMKDKNQDLAATEENVLRGKTLVLRCFSESDQ